MRAIRFDEFGDYSALPDGTLIGGAISANNRELWAATGPVLPLGLDDAEHAVAVGSDGSIDWLCGPRGLRRRRPRSARDGRCLIAPTLPPRAVKRRVIKESGKNQHHDMLVADVLNEGRPQLVFWNQGARALFLARIPEHPRDRNTPWDLNIIHQADAPMEGMAMADIDGDGVVEVVGGGRWFKHEGGLNFTAHVIDDRQKFSRAAAGKLIKDSHGAQVVFDSGDGCGELNWYERRPDGTWAAHNLLGKDVVHGHTLRVGDIDNDGNLDIFCAEMAKWCGWTRTVDYPRAHLWVFYGDGRGNFEKVTIAEGRHGTHEAQLADFSGNGRLDILGKPYMAGAPGVDIWLNPGRG